DLAACDLIDERGGELRATGIGHADEQYLRNCRVAVSDEIAEPLPCEAFCERDQCRGHPGSASKGGVRFPDDRENGGRVKFRDPGSQLVGEMSDSRIEIWSALFISHIVRPGGCDHG